MNINSTYQMAELTVVLLAVPKVEMRVDLERKITKMFKIIFFCKSSIDRINTNIMKYSKSVNHFIREFSFE